MHRKLLQFLEEHARAAGFEPMQNCATFNLTKSPQAKGILPGAVYGIAIVLDDIGAKALEEEASAKASLKTPLHRIRPLPLGDVSAIPLYWQIKGDGGD